MKTYINVLVLFVAIILLSSCDKDDSTPKPASSSINKIMPLGASRVEGSRPNYESFRYELWKDLIENEWTFDFVGTQSDDADYPRFNNTDFDIDHEGRGGWTSGQILDDLEGWISEAGVPDIVLLSSPGGNDALQGLPYAQAISNINAIIDLLQAANPDITIIIEQLAPARSDAMTTALTIYFNQIHEDIPDITAEQSTSTSKVIAVDMSTDFTDDYYADEVHYNEQGAEVVASRYYDVLVDLLDQ